MHKTKKKRKEKLILFRLFRFYKKKSEKDKIYKKIYLQQQKQKRKYSF